MAAPAPAAPIEQGAASSEAADEAPDRVADSTETVLRVHDIFCEVPGKATVERALRSCSGVTDVSVDLETKLARVQGSAPADVLVAALEAFTARFTACYQQSCSMRIAKSVDSPSFT